MKKSKFDEIKERATYPLTSRICKMQVFEVEGLLSNFAGRFQTYIRFGLPILDILGIFSAFLTICLFAFWLGFRPKLPFFRFLRAFSPKRFQGF